MKKLLVILSLALSSMAYSQELSFENPIIETENGRFELVSADDWGNHVIRYEKYSNGLIIESGRFVNGKKDGTWHQYDRNGNVVSSMEFENDTRVRMVTMSGGREVTVIYRNGKAIEVTYYLASN